MCRFNKNNTAASLTVVTLKELDTMLRFLLVFFGILGFVETLGSPGSAGGSGQVSELCALLHRRSAGLRAELRLLSVWQCHACHGSSADDVTVSVSAPLIPRCRPQSAQLHVEAWWPTHFQSQRRGFSWYGSRFFRSPSPRCTLRRQRWSCIEPQSASDFAQCWTDGGAVLGLGLVRLHLSFHSSKNTSEAKCAQKPGGQKPNMAVKW